MSRFNDGGIGYAIETAWTTLARVRMNASPDMIGMRRVYRTADGLRAFADDGVELSPAEISRVDWRPDASTWEMRQVAKNLLQAIP